MKKLMILDLRYVVFQPTIFNCVLQWLEQTFLKYLNDWEAYVKSKDAIPKAAKQFCLLPSQTTSGLKMTGKHIIIFMVFPFNDVYVLSFQCTLFVRRQNSCCHNPMLVTYCQRGSTRTQLRAILDSKDQEVNATTTHRNSNSCTMHKQL